MSGGNDSQNTWAGVYKKCDSGSGPRGWIARTMHPLGALGHISPPRVPLYPLCPLSHNRGGDEAQRAAVVRRAIRP